MNTNEYIKGINEADYCFNKCPYHNLHNNWCKYYDCSVYDVDCDRISYDSYDKKFYLD